jgi:AraC-like DNA-binding protein
MIAHVRVPGAPLSRFVELLWFQQRDAVAPSVEAALPEGTVEWVIDLEDQRQPGHVIGPHSRPFEIRVNGQQRVLGVHFKPGGASPFLALPADELHNQIVSVDGIWGESVLALRELLGDALSIPDMFDLLERFLTARITLPVLHPAVTFGISRLIRPTAASSIASITDAVGLSERRFAQVFREQVGLKPKTFARVRRFQQVLRQVNATVALRVDWAEVAITRGYADQAHLIHEFRDMSGLSPSAYLTRRDGRLNHFVLDG